MSWRMDETYVKVKGEWRYLYRAVDKEDWEREAPITRSLLELLLELGWKQNVGKNEYTIAPEVKNRERLMDVISRSFTHYWRL